MSIYKDITGKKFNYLTPIKPVYKDSIGHTHWLCKCDCGNEIIVDKAHITSGHTKSCGCFSIKVHSTHSSSKSRLYKIWIGMRNRCKRKVQNYGKKGIKVCPEWDRSFVAFQNWALNNGYADDLSIDRINNDGDYCPENCRWATYKEQNSHLNSYNTLFSPIYIMYNGEKHTLREWAKIKNIKYKTILARYERGWSIERMLETPTIKEIKRGEDGRWKLS